MNGDAGVAAALRRRKGGVRSLATVLALALLALAGWAVVTTRVPEAPAAQPCTDTWFSYLDENYTVSDGDGHGPDPGSREWFNVFERRTGLPVTDNLTPLQRCRLIQQRLESRRFVVNDPLGIAVSF